MFGKIRRHYERRRARRELRRKGVVSPRQLFDREAFHETLEHSPALAVFTLVLVWVCCTVLMTLATVHQHREQKWIVGQEATKTIHAAADFSFVDQRDLEGRRALVRENQPEFFRVDAARVDAVNRNFTDFFAAADVRLRRKPVPAAEPAVATPDSLPERLALSAPEELIAELGKYRQLQESFASFKRQLGIALRQGVIGMGDKASRNVGQRVRVISLGDRRLQEKPVTELWDCATLGLSLSRELFKEMPDDDGKTRLLKTFAEISALLIGRDGDLVFDTEETKLARDEAAAGVTAVPRKVVRGEVLVSLGDVVTPQTLEILRYHQEAERQSASFDQGLATLGYNLVWSLVLIIFGAFYMYHIHPDVVGANKRVTFIGLVVILSLLVNFGANGCYELFVSITRDLRSSLAANAIPVALGSVILAVVFGYRVALCVGFFIASITAMMVAGEFTFDMALKGMVISSLAALAVRSATDYRAYFLRILATVFPLTFVLNLNLLDWQSRALPALHELGGAAALALGNAFVTGILALVLIFTFELVFNVSTNMALMVLADYNHPLLERLKREAPGTFFHCLMVATLAEDAARAINANPLKAKVGALFHDIGKLSMPQYFTENNIDSANQHLSLNPQMSSIIIRDHVKEGLKLAQQYRLCRTIRDAINQHHGNDLVHYFYNKALAEKRREGAAPVLESHYRYNGPPPQDKEMAIISLADACEAACRSLDKPSSGKIEGVVNEIFFTRYRDGQLNSANLTLAELEKVRQSFVNTLVSMKHGRITYQRELKHHGAHEQPVGNEEIPAPEEKRT